MPLTLAEVKAKTLRLISDELDAGVHKGMDLLAVFDVLSKAERRLHLNAQGRHLRAFRERMIALREQAAGQRAKAQSVRQAEPQTSAQSVGPVKAPGKNGNRHMLRLRLNELNNSEMRFIMDARRHWLLNEEIMGYRPSGLTEHTKGKENNLVSAFFTWLGQQPQGTQMIAAWTDQPTMELEASEARALDLIRYIESQPAKPFDLNPSPELIPTFHTAPNAGTTTNPEQQPQPPQPAEAPISKPIASLWEKPDQSSPATFIAQGLGPGNPETEQNDEKPLTPFEALAQKQLAYYDYPDPNAEDPPE